MISPSASEMSAGDEVTWAPAPGWIMKREPGLPLLGRVIREALGYQRLAPDVAGLKVPMGAVGVVRPLHAVPRADPRLKKALDAFAHIARHMDDILDVASIEAAMARFHADIGAALRPDVDAFELESLLSQGKALCRAFVELEAVHTRRRSDVYYDRAILSFAQDFGITLAPLASKTK